MPTYPHPYTYPTGTVKSGYGNGQKPDNPQYVSLVRHQSKTFGKHKRYTLKKIKREMRENDMRFKSRFQLFQDLGFQQGLGALNCRFIRPNGNDDCGEFPFHIWDVTSMPVADESSSATPLLPVRGYRLAYTTPNAANREAYKFGWLPINRVQNGVAHNIDPTFTTNNVACVTEKTGTGKNFVPIGGTGPPQVQAPHASGFTHDWSDIRMVLYPQTGLPAKWHVALISFPDTLVVNGGGGALDNDVSTAGPCTYAYASGTSVIPRDPIDQTYSAERSQNFSAHDNLDLRWQKFFSGKIQHPNNRDNSAVGTLNPSDPKLPFKIVEHESFFQPARDNPSFGGSAQRLIKKLFYRRGWTFPPNSGIGFAEQQGDALNNLDTIQLHRSRNASGSSPYPKPSEIVYLAIWCESYVQDVGGGTLETLKEEPFIGLVNAASPSYDLVVRMKHTINPTQNSVSTGVPRPDGP